MVTPGGRARAAAPALLLALFLAAPLLAWPDSGRWLGVRACVMQCGALALAALVLARARWEPRRLGRFLSSGPNLAVLLLLGWSTLSLSVVAPRTGTGRDLAVAEWLRIGCGAALYFAVAYGVRTRLRLRQAVLLVLAGAGLAGLAGVLSAASAPDQLATAAFGNSQLLAAFLVLLLPVAAVFA